MPHFKDTENKVHFLDDAQYAYLLPAGSVEITDEEAVQLNYRAPTTAELNAPIYAQLDELDKKLIRPLSEGETDRVAEIVAQKQALRAQLVQE